MSEEQKVSQPERVEWRRAGSLLYTLAETGRYFRGEAVVANALMVRVEADPRFSSADQALELTERLHTFLSSEEQSSSRRFEETCAGKEELDEPSSSQPSDATELVERGRKVWKTFFYPARSDFVSDDSTELKGAIYLEMADCLRLTLDALEQAAQAQARQDTLVSGEGVG